MNKDRHSLCYEKENSTSYSVYVSWYDLMVES